MTDWWTGRYEMATIRPLPAAIPAQGRQGLGPVVAVFLAAVATLAIIVALWFWIDRNGGDAGAGSSPGSQPGAEPPASDGSTAE